MKTSIATSTNSQQPRTNNGSARKLMMLAATVFLLLMMSTVASAQLTGTKNIPGNYADLAAAITDLNTQGVGAGGVTFNVVAGNPQTAPAGGYVIGGTGSLVLTTSSAANPIVFTGNSNTITAPTPQAAGNLNDGIFKLIGADWVTIQGFSMLENAANTTTAAGTNNMTEWGVALLYVSTTDGAQNDTIQNNTIDLDRTYQNTFGIYSNSTHSATAVTTSATATGAAGSNDNLKVYGNNITDVNNGLVVVGPTAAADQNNTVDIGGVALATGNTITNFGTTGTFSGYANVSGTVNGILVRNTKNYNVSFNTVTSSNGGVTVTGTLNGIQVPSSSVAPTGTLTQTINNNNISMRGGNIANVLDGINVPSTSVNATTTLSINNNDFNTFGHTVAGGTGAINFIIESGNPLSTSLNGNTFTNISVNTTGTITFFTFAQSLISGASLSITNNSIVTGFTRTGVGTTTVWTSNASSVNGSTHAINNNNFSNFTLTGASAFNGITDTDGASSSSGPVKTVNGNTFNNINTGAGTVVPMSVNFSGANTNVNNNTISNITTSNSITCLTIGTSNQATVTVAGNLIDPITSGGTAVIGISAGATTAVYSKNKLYDLSGTAAGSVVSGIQIVNAAANSNVTLSNNLVGNLTAPAATGTNAVIGINITGSATTSTFNVFYNTVYVNNTTSGVGFGSSGISAVANATGTTSALNLRNNIIVNTSVQNGAGLTVAYRRSVGTAGTLANYANSSNNNLFYAGTPSATNLIYADGTSSAQTIAAYRSGAFTAGTISPRDTFSVSEAPPFLSTTGSSANFLHINPATPTQIESGGAPIGTVTDDFDGNARNATFPDIGADEFSGIAVDSFGPNITYTLLANTSSTANRTLNATITDVSGVAGGANAPRIYYRKNGGSYFSNQCGAPSGSVYPCVIDNSLVGGVTQGDLINYFVVAQDTTGNVSGNPAAGFTATDVNNVTSPPTTPNSYTIAQGFAGAISVGTAETFTSLTNDDAQGLFKAINNGVVTANITVNLTSDLTVETGTILLNQTTEEGVGGYTIFVQPSGGARLISGSNTTALINLNGADRVTFSGLPFGGHSLTIRNTSATTGAVIQMANDASSNSVLSCTIEGGNTSTSSALILIGAGTTSGNDNNAVTGSIIRDRTDVAGVPANLVASLNGSLTATNSLNVISGNQMMNFINNGFATSSGATSDNWTVTNNEISQNATRAANTFGINTGGMTGTNTISGNSIHGFVSSGTNAILGFLVGNSLNLTISGNRIYDFQTTAGATGTIEGVEFDGASGGAANLTLFNNMITLAPTVSTAQSVIGIQDFAFGGNTFTANHNSVYIGGTSSGALASWAMKRGNLAPTTYTARNNLCFNNRTGASNNNFAGGDDSANTGTFVSNNNFFAGTGLTPANFMDYGTTSTGTPVSFAAWQAGPPARDANSTAGLASSFVVSDIFVDVSTGDLHIKPTAGAILGGGASGTGVTIDIDNDPRPASNPDIGADELVQSVAGTLAAGTYYNASTGNGDLLGGDVTITNILYLGGILNAGANTLTIDCNGTVSGASPTSYITGNLKKNYCATGVKGFEVGTANGYSPVSVNVTAGTFPANFMVKAVQGPQPNVNAATSLQRYWTLTEGGDITANLNFNYNDPLDIMGTEANYHLIRVSGGTPVAFPNNCPVPGATQACVDFVGNQATINGVTNFSDWTLGGVNAPTAAPATITGRVTTTSGAPMAGVTMYLSGARSARAITDAQGNYRFANLNTDNFYTLTPSITNYHFSPSSRSFSLLANVTDAVFTGTLDAVSSGNVIDMPEYFVRQHYLDFLGREPDDAGFNFWSEQLASCGNDYNCIEHRTINVSAAYFLSIEFQKTGRLVDGLYLASYGRAPRYAEFIPDTARVARNVIVNQAGWEGVLATNKEEFLAAWVERPEFHAAYDNLSNEGYVDALIGHTGVTFTNAERAALVGGLNGGSLSRAGALGQVAENERFASAKFNEAFVRMEYFGYLRRDPDDAGFHFWLNKLNEFEGNFERAEMVKAFIVSGEYRDRFRQ